MTINLFRRRVGSSFIATVGILLLCSVIFAPSVFAADASETASSGTSNLTWVCISAALAFAAGAIAAGFAISHVGTAAMGALSERPEIGSQALIFIALAEGLVVFGFITALMILGKV